MKNKVLSLFLIAFLLIPNYSASETKETLPRWVDVSYSDLATDQVSEYQMVTITVSKWSPLFITNNSEISIDYDEEVLNLQNTYIRNSLNNNEEVEGTTVTSTDAQYKAVYQFFLNSEVDTKQTMVEINRTIGDKNQTIQVPINCQSLKLKKNVTFGNTTLSYGIDEYTNDSQQITMDMNFEVIATDGSPITISIKENTMSVSSTDDYEIKLRFTDGEAKAIDKNNFKLKMSKGDTFNLYVTANIDGLESKDDKFTFFILISDGENFTRLEPKFYRNHGVQISLEESQARFFKTKAILIIGYIMLIIAFAVSSKRNYLFKRNTKTPSSKKKREKKQTVESVDVKNILNHDDIESFDDFDKLK